MSRSRAHSTKPAARSAASGQDAWLLVSDGDLLAERQRLLDRQRRFMEIAAAINASEDPDRVLRLVRDAVVDSGMFERAGVWVLQGGSFRGSWGTDSDGNPRDERDFVQDPEAWGAGIEAIMSGAQPFVVKRCLLDEEGDPRIVQPVNHAIVALRASGELLGVLSVDNLLTQRPLEDADVLPLLPFADMAAAALRSARMTLERKRLLDRQRRFMEIAATMNASGDPDQVLRLVRDAVVESAIFDRAGVWLVEGDKFRGAWGTDLDGRLRDEHHLLEDAREWGPLLPLLLVGEKQYVLTTHVPVDNENRPINVDVDHALVALTAGSELVGILSVDNLLSARPILEEDVQSLLPFADMASVALRAARVSHERNRLMERQRRLMQLAAGMNASLELWQILRMVHDAVIETAGFDRAGVLLYDSAHDAILGAWGTDRSGRAVDGAGWSMRREEDHPNSAFWHVMEGRLPYYHTSDYTREFGLQPSDQMYGVRHHAVVPMKTSGEIVGVICVDNLLTGRSFSASEVEHLAPFAEQAALAIRNAGLFQKLQTAQEALLRSEKLRALGEMAGGVAHNINNLLTAVLGYAELIRQHPESPESVQRFAAIIERAGMDGADIVRRIQQFARRDANVEFEVFDLFSIVKDAEDLCRPYLVEKSANAACDIALTLRATEDTPVLGHASELREVVVNLVRNAVDAMPEGGEIVIDCRAEGNEAVLQVIDNGCGMDESTRLRVFEPFFTTKGPGLGLGLGLSMAWGVVTRHSGSIHVESNPGEGATFTVRIPLVAENRQEKAGQDEWASLEGLRILVVDDETLVLDSVSRLLGSCGAVVSQAEGAVAALAWLDANQGECDLILTDQTMPGITGLELLAIAELEYPQILRVLLSGWGAARPDGVDMEAAQLILAKPAAKETLMRELSSLVREKRRSRSAA